MKKTMTIVALVALVAVLCVAMVACIPSDPNKAISNLEKEGYTAVKDATVIPAALRLAQVKGVETVVTAANKDGEHVTLIYFDSTENAKAAYSTVESYAKKNDKSKDEVAIKKSGKIIYYGSEAGVKAVK